MAKNNGNLYLIWEKDLSLAITGIMKLVITNPEGWIFQSFSQPPAGVFLQFWEGALGPFRLGKLAQ